jgi:chromosome transmission fidelity protein 4
LTLLHWRKPSRASWIPLLDTKLLPRLASGRKHETYFPIAVADNKFHCIILKGGDQYPYFPRPLLSEFDFAVPLTATPPKEKTSEENGEREGSPGADEDEDESETRKLEQQYLLKGLQAAQLSDLIDASSSTHTQRSTLGRLELEVDKTLLQLVAIECREGEDRGMRALEMVELMRDKTGRMIEAAGKVAERYGRSVLGEKIREIGERRVNGMDEDDF